MNVLMTVNRVVDFNAKVRVRSDRLGVDFSPRLKTPEVFGPPKRSACIKVFDAATLVSRLKRSRS